jgi:hypothetical protein
MKPSNDATLFQPIVARALGAGGVIRYRWQVWAREASMAGHPPAGGVVHGSSKHQQKIVEKSRSTLASASTERLSS